MKYEVLEGLFLPTEFSRWVPFILINYGSAECLTIVSLSSYENSYGNWLVLFSGQNLWPPFIKDFSQEATSVGNGQSSVGNDEADSFY